LITDPVASIASFDSKEFPNCAAAVMNQTLHILSIENIRRNGFSEIALGISARRAVVVEHYIVVLTEQPGAGHALHVFDMITHSSIDQYQLPE
jgi:hypothetical protein